jgi:hypothetical protein
LKYWERGGGEEFHRGEENFSLFRRDEAQIPDLFGKAKAQILFFFLVTNTMFL